MLKTRPSPLLVAIVVIGAVVRFWAIGFGLPHTQARPDETHIIDIALSLLKGTPPPPFYDYPWLYALAVSALYLGYYIWGLSAGFFDSLSDLTASWPLFWEPFFLLSRSLSALVGTATILVVYWLGRRLWDHATGLIAAFFLSLSFLHVRDSHFGTTDTAMTLLVMIAIALLLKAHDSAKRSHFVLAGVVAGFAAATKYNAVLLAVPLLCSYLLHVGESSDRRRAASDARLLLFGAPFALAFAIGVPFVVFDAERLLQTMTQLWESMRAASPSVDLTNGWWHHLQFSLRYGIGLPLLIAGLAGTVAVAVREPKLALLLLSFPFAYFAVIGGVNLRFFRYAIPLVPFLCLTAADFTRRLVDRFASSIADRRGAWYRPMVGAATFAVAALIVTPSALRTWQFNQLLDQPDNRVVVAQWFKNHVPPGSSILQSGSQFGHVQFDREQHYVNWAWDRSRMIFVVNRRPAEGRPEWIVVQESPLPSATQDLVREFLKEGYTFVQAFNAVSLKENRVYDRQDAFFAPFAGFARIRRPGPNFFVYRRLGEGGPPIQTGHHAASGL